MNRYEPLPARMKLAAYLLTALGACLLLGALWMPKEKKPEGWLPLQSELSAALAELDNKRNRAKAPGENPLQPSSQLAEPVYGGGTTIRSGNADAALTAGIAGDTAAGDSVPPNSGGKVDLNRANAEQLEALPGIGPAKARAMIEDRSKNGPFRSIEDVTRVKGIGSGILEKMKDSVVVDP